MCRLRTKIHFDLITPTSYTRVLLTINMFFLIMQAVVWIILGIFSVIRFEPDYLLIVGVCLTLSIANIVGFTKCRKGIEP
jgi:hypothetical protein